MSRQKTSTRRSSRAPQKTPPVQTDLYAAIHSAFAWQVPKHYNTAQVCSRRWAQAADATTRTAIVADGTGLQPHAYNYAELQAQANQLSHALHKLGVKRGDRVAIVLPQRFETAVAYMAVMQMGAVAMPLSILFGPEALSYRLQNSETVVAIADDNSIGVLAELHQSCPSLQQLVAVGAHCPAPALSWSALLQSEPTHFDLVDTLAEDPAVLIYTSGTTGNPKGALIPHRALIGNLTGFTASQNWFGFDPFNTISPANDHDLPRGSQAVFWSPADWAWTGGLMDALLPTLYYGRPIVAFNGRFSPQTAFELIERHGVTHSFLFPTALKAMMKAYPEPRAHFNFDLQAIMSAGEAVGDAVFAYCQQQLGVTVN